MNVSLSYYYYGNLSRPFTTPRNVNFTNSKVYKAWRIHLQGTMNIYTQFYGNEYIIYWWDISVSVKSIQHGWSRGCCAVFWLMLCPLLCQDNVWLCTCIQVVFSLLCHLTRAAGSFLFLPVVCFTIPAWFSPIVHCVSSPWLQIEAPALSSVHFQHPAPERHHRPAAAGRHLDFICLAFPQPGSFAQPLCPGLLCKDVLVISYLCSLHSSLHCSSSLDSNREANPQFCRLLFLEIRQNWKCPHPHQSFPFNPKHQTTTIPCSLHVCFSYLNHIEINFLKH